MYRSEARRRAGYLIAIGSMLASVGVVFLIAGGGIDYLPGWLHFMMIVIPVIGAYCGACLIIGVQPFGQ